MKKLYFVLLAIFIFSGALAFAKTAQAAKAWKPSTPDGYSPITWAKAPGIATFFKAPGGNGSLDFITRIYLPENQIGFIASTSEPLDWGMAETNFIDNTAMSPAASGTDTGLSENAGTAAATNTAADSFHNYAFTRLVAETAKNTSSSPKFIWNAPFFNIINSVSDLSLAIKSTVGTTTLITSGSRPAADMTRERRMLIINNQTASATIANFDPAIFVSSTGDQAVEGFAPTVAINDDASGAAARLFLGVSTSSKELVVYCSQRATVQEASDALAAAGIPPERQLGADGGGSATCGYNLPGQFFVEPTRMLPLLMGATTIVARGTAMVNGLNVRNGPSTKYAIVAKLAKGAPIRAFEEKNGWYRIGDGQWVIKTLIKKI